MNVNPYESPKSNEPAKSPAILRPWYAQPVIAPFLGAAIGAGGGALYGFCYFVARFFGGLEAEEFVIEALEAVLGFGIEFGILGGAIGLVLGAVLWIMSRLDPFRNHKPI